jgi:hypothetical protein
MFIKTNKCIKRITLLWCLTDAPTSFGADAPKLVGASVKHHNKVIILMQLLVFMNIYEITPTLTVTFVSLFSEQLVTHSTSMRIECRGISQVINGSPHTVEIRVPSQGRRFEFRV